MIFARNRHNLRAGYPRYVDDNRFQLDPGREAVKLTVRVRYANAVLMVADDFPPTYDNPSYKEMLLEPGFHTKVFPTPITGWQFRAELYDSGIPGSDVFPEVDFVAYD